MILVVVLGVGSIVSWRYHFFFANYGSFVVEQVLPCTDSIDLLESAVRKPAHVGQPDEVRLDRWPLSSALFRNFNTPQDRINPIGSDYLGVWHYVREVLRGKDPYEFQGFVTYNIRVRRHPMIKDPTVPAQHVGEYSYFPGGLLLVAPFYRASYFASFFTYLAVLGAFLIGAAVLAVRRAVDVRWPLGMLLGTLFFTCFPLDMLVDRGNVEGVLFMLIASGLYAYRSGRHKLAAVCFGIAASAKAYPGIFFALFLLDRRYLALFTGIATTAVATLGTMLCMHAPLAVIAHELSARLSGFNSYFLLQERSVRFNHSFFNLMKGTVWSDLDDRNVSSDLQRFAAVYPWLVIAVTGFMLWRLRGLDFRHRVLVLTVAMVSFPFISNDYTLVHLLAPFCLFTLSALRRDQHCLRDLAPLFLLSFLFLPKEYLVELYGFRWGIGFACNGMALAALLALGLSATPKLPAAQAAATA